jgi:hypothetical protein
MVRTSTGSTVAVLIPLQKDQQRRCPRHMDPLDHCSPSAKHGLSGPMSVFRTLPSFSVHDIAVHPAWKRGGHLARMQIILPVTEIGRCVFDPPLAAKRKFQQGTATRRKMQAYPGRDFLEVAGGRKAGSRRQQSKFAMQ